MLLIICIDAQGQAWLSGYEFRKKITFDKTKIEGDFINSSPRTELDVVDFPVLVELQDEAFKHQDFAVCSGILTDLEGRNVAFVTAAAPTVKLSFQIESYDPAAGRYRCWVKIPSLASARTNTPATAIYFYYGGSVLHDSRSPASLGTWNGLYSGVWHIEGVRAGLSSLNSRSVAVAEQLRNFPESAPSSINGKLGKAVELNGIDQHLFTAGHDHTTFTLTAWIKWNGGAAPQVMAANDSVAPGKKMGWKLSVNSDGKLELITYRSLAASYSFKSAYAVPIGTWTYICCSYSHIGTTSTVNFMINGTNAGGSSGSGLKMTPSEGYLSIGCSKSGDQYFKGAIDELRVFNVETPLYWLKNEYKNQDDPLVFYSVGQPEFHPAWATFTGAVNANWATTANWLNNQKPISGSKVRIVAGKTTKMTGADNVFNQLILEAGAALSSTVNLQLDCDLQLGIGSSLTMEAGKALVLKGEGLSIQGDGTVNTDILEVNTASSESEIELKTDVKVSKELRLTRGKLKANGNLWLLASREASAVLSPVLDPGNTSIAGEVNVQTFVDGSFPEPASGRGWRLWSAPVRNSIDRYNLYGVKSSVFVTGKGGAENGFDGSPNNGATIFTHDQSLPGTLKEKFVPIPDLNLMIPFGKGFYIFSRGSRLVENAYQDQIQQQPFVNPAPYLVTYRGKLFVGDLTVEVRNRNLGEEGDGYNLLGNPYASPIKWGSLIKENVGPFIWMFDPLNGAYRVSSDPETIIPAGAGFFVKVLNGFEAGTVKFTEASKEKQ